MFTFCFPDDSENQEQAVERLKKALTDPDAAAQDSFMATWGGPEELAEPVVQALVRSGHLAWALKDESEKQPVVYLAPGLAEGDPAHWSDGLVEPSHRPVLVKLAPDAGPVLNLPDWLAGATGGGNTGNNPPQGTTPSQPAGKQNDGAAGAKKPDGEKQDEGKGAGADKSAEPVEPSGGSRADVIRALAAARRDPSADLQATLSGDAEKMGKLAEAHLLEQSGFNEAIVWQASPDERMLALVNEDKRSELALGLLKARLRSAQLTDVELLELAEGTGKSALAAQLLRARAGVPESAADLATQRVEFEKKRVEYLGKAIEYTSEYIEQRKRWRDISKWVPGLLVGTLAASLGLTVWLFCLLAAKAVDGWQAALIIFVLAVVAVSPAALLLLERPLAGVDSFQPPGSDSAKAGDGAAGDTPGKEDKSKAGDTKKDDTKKAG